MSDTDTMWCGNSLGDMGLDDNKNNETEIF